MTVVCSMIGVTDDGMGSQVQSLVNNVAGGVLVAPTTDTLCYWDTTNFKVLSTGLQLKGNNTNTAPPAGFIGQQIRSAVASGSAVSVTNNTPTNVTSISLTAGIWDVSAIVAVQGIVAGVSIIGSISQTSATNGTLGDNSMQAGVLNLLSPQMISIPSYRISLTSTTTVYMVATVGFSLGTVSCFGRISATRVG